jgi:hypothetical protein
MYDGWSYGWNNQPVAERISNDPVTKTNSPNRLKESKDLKRLL